MPKPACAGGFPKSCFCPSFETIRQPQAQIGYPFVKKSVRHLYLLTHTPDGSVFMRLSYHKETTYTRLDKLEITAFREFLEKILRSGAVLKIKADKKAENGYNRLDIATDKGDRYGTGKQIQRGRALR